MFYNFLFKYYVTKLNNEFEPFPFKTILWCQHSNKPKWYGPSYQDNERNHNPFSPSHSQQALLLSQKSNNNALELFWSLLKVSTCSQFLLRILVFLGYVGHWLVVVVVVVVWDHCGEVSMPPE